MRIAIISINIGEYLLFWEEFYKTAEVNFLPDCDREYFVFTDADCIYASDNAHVHQYYHKDQGWPFNTMKRFGLFCSIENELRKFDYVFFINANARFMFPLTQDFIWKEKNIITVEHPGMHGKDLKSIPWERRKESRAYVPYELGKVYVQGAFCGGKANAFIQMAKELDALTEDDLAENMVAVWHDESFLNKYIIGRKDVQILGWQYLKYEEYVFPYRPVIELRDKKKYLSSANGRFKGRNSWHLKYLLFLRNAAWYLLIQLHICKRYDLLDSEGNYTDLDISE